MAALTIAEADHDPGVDLQAVYILSRRVEQEIVSLDRADGDRRG